MVKLKTSLRKIYSRHHDLVKRYEIYVSQMTTDSSIGRIHNQVLSLFMTYHRRVPHVEQEQLTLPEFFPLCFTCLNGVRVFPFCL